MPKKQTTKPPLAPVSLDVRHDENATNHPAADRGVTIEFFNAVLRSLGKLYRRRTVEPNRFELFRRHLAEAERLYAEMPTARK